MTVLVPLVVVTLWSLIPVVGLMVRWLNAGARGPWLKWLIILTAPLGLAAYFAIRWAMFTPAIVLERRGAIAGLQRSGDLARSEWFRVFGVIVVMTIIVLILSLLPSALVPFAVAATGSSGVVGSLAINAASIAGEVLFGALVGIAFTCCSWICATDVRAPTLPPASTCWKALGRSTTSACGRSNAARSDPMSEDQALDKLSTIMARRKRRSGVPHGDHPELVHRVGYSFTAIQANLLYAETGRNHPKTGLLRFSMKGAAEVTRPAADADYGADLPAAGQAPRAARTVVRPRHITAISGLASTTYRPWRG